MRAGKTKTTSFSLEPRTIRLLKAMAERRHRGNVSAMLTELAEREAKLEAAQAFFEKYGFPQLTESDVADIEAEWRGESPRRRQRRRTA